MIFIETEVFSNVPRANKTSILIFISFKIILFSSNQTKIQIDT